MPANNRLKQLAADQGISVQLLVKQTVEKCGTEVKAAVELGVYPNTIRYHLRKLNESEAKTA